MRSPRVSKRDWVCMALADSTIIAPQDEGARFVICAYVTFLCCVAVSGGASHIDAASQPVVRTAAIVSIAALIVRYRPFGIPALKPAFWFMFAIGAVIALQLIPLPPQLWSALPGRARYVAAAVAAGEPQPWRPLNLTPDRGWNALFALLPPFAALAALSRLQSRHQRIVLATWVAVALASAMIGLAQISSGGDDALRFYAVHSPHAAVGLFANRNHQALLLCCGLPLLAFWGAAGTEGAARALTRTLITVVAATFLILMIPTTGSRAGLALGLLALPIAVVLGWPGFVRAGQTLSRRQRRAVGGIGLLLLFATLAMAATFARAEAVQRLFQTDPTDDARVKLLHPLLGMIRSFFPAGSGFGSFDPVYRGFEPFNALALSYMYQAHNDYLQIVMEGGLAGLLSLLTFLGWWMWTSIRLWRQSHSEAVGFGRLGSVIILLMLVASAVDYPLRTPLMMVIAMQAVCWMLMALQQCSVGPIRTFTRS